MVEETKRKLNIPPWHLPYLEKYRIYELFHELAKEIVIQQPADHVLFLKQILAHAAKNRDTARVILLSSPKINGVEVARQIAQHTKQAVITQQYLLARISMHVTNNAYPKIKARALSHILHAESIYSTGWIAVDCIKTQMEAKALVEIGVFPTHVIHLIAPFTPPLTELLYCHVVEGWPEYRQAIMGIRDVFKHRLMEVHLHKREIEEVAEECANIIKIRKIYGGPSRPRVLILGPRGCGRKTQAKMLVQRLNLLHVDFEYLLCQAWVSKTELGKKLRSCKDDVCFQSDLLTEVVNQRILDMDCLEQGWVMTGFPFTVSDFKYFDCLDTPPNRVIFLECDLSICRERLKNRKINIHSGSTTNVANDTSEILAKRLATHPKDEEGIIDAELNYYCENYGSLRSYCHDTASVVNGDQPVRWVFECITAIIARDSPTSPPRCPCDEIADPSGSGTSISTNKSRIPSTAFVSYFNQFGGNAL